MNPNSSTWRNSRLRSSHSPFQDHYAVLGLASTASIETIRQAYRDLIKRYHPDTTTLPPDQARQRFQQLKQAYEVLSDPEERERYDRQRSAIRLKVLQTRIQKLKQGNGALVTPSPETEERDSAYLPAYERPLSGGEIFALCILGLTFLGCIILVITLGLFRGEWIVGT